MQAKLLYACTGLNTIVDPARIAYTADTGINDLATAVNVSIDDTGLIRSRLGDTLASAGEYHSAFCAMNSAFVVHERTSDAAIMQIASDLSLTGVRSGLPKNVRVSFAQVNDETYYSTLSYNGVIKDGVSSAWPVDSYEGPNTNFGFQAAPLGQLIAHKRGGLMFIANGKVVYVNHIPYQFGLYNLRSGFMQFQSDIQMLCPTTTGIFVSDASRVWFFRGTTWTDFSQELGTSYPAIPWTLAHDPIPLVEMGIEMEGNGYVWASMEGLCVGTDSGTIINLTKAKVKYPSGFIAGACLVTDTHILHTAY